MEALMSVIVEIRAAEGGDDAKQLVLDQLVIYRKRAVRRGL
jgi:protein subunit release factor A